MAGHIRLKLCVVVIAVFWFFLMIYVMSSMRGKPHDPVDITKKIDLLKQVGNLALARVAKSKTVLDEYLHHTWKENSFNNSQASAKYIITSKLKADVRKVVKVVVSGDVESLLGVLAMMNSVVTNTHQHLHFYVTLPIAVISHFNEWVSQTKVRSATLTVKPHPPKVPRGKPHYAKIFLKNIFPNLKGRFVYLDPDIIVQGNLSELMRIPITSNQYGAFTKDCLSASRRHLTRQFHYSSHLNLLHPAIRPLKIRPNSCIPNTGVFVSEAHLWANASHLMQELISASTINDPIHSSMADEGIAALLAVMYGHMASLPRIWHLPGLGERAQVSYSKDFVHSVKLLHWNGHFKPWSRKAPFSDIWLRYYLADPRGKYRPARMSV